MFVVNAAGARGRLTGSAALASAFALLLSAPSIGAAQQPDAGVETDPFTRVDTNIEYAFRSGPEWLSAAAISLRATNLFAADYATPGGYEHRQTAILRDGRTVTLRVAWRR